jgi:hypothetical protein
VIALLTIALNTNANPHTNDPKDTLRTCFKVVDAKTLVKVIVIIIPARINISIKILNVSKCFLDVKRLKKIVQLMNSDHSNALVFSFTVNLLYKEILISLY